jgi:hypothetical protein
MTKRKKLFRICVTTLLIFIAAIWLAAVVPINPYGQFRADDIGSEGDAFWQFDNGVMYLVVYKSADPKDGAIYEPIGNYRYDGKRWILENAWSAGEIHATVFSVEWIATNRTRSGKFPRRWSLP